MQFAYSVGEASTRSGSSAISPEKALYMSAIAIVDDLEGQSPAGDNVGAGHLRRVAATRIMADRVRARGGAASVSVFGSVVQLSSADHFSSFAQAPTVAVLDLTNGSRPPLAQSVKIFMSAVDALDQLRSTVSLLEISAIALQGSASSARSVGCDWEKAIQELWEMVGVSSDGDDPVEAETVSGIERLLPVLRPMTDIPAFEIHDDGSVSLRWEDSARPRSFALHFHKQFVNAVLSVPASSGGFAERIETANELAMLRVLQREAVADLLR